MQLDCNTAWTRCLQVISEKVDEQAFKTWFSPISPLRMEDNVLTIQVPSQFFYEWLEEHYVHLLRRAIDIVLGEKGRLAYSVIVDKGNNQNQPYVVNLPGQKTGSGRPYYPQGNSSTTRPANQFGNHNSYSRQHSPVTTLNNPFAMRKVDTSQIPSNLNKQYIFDTYIEGDCNRLARSAGMAVANKPGITSFNPLMLYGGVGLGKTHLVQAIGNEIRRKQEGKFVLYVSSEKFTSQFIESLKVNNVQEFSNFYLQVDVLIIDDVQFLSGKEKTQEIFFHIFNHLHQNGKQIIMTSDCPPRDLKGLQERLLSRFKWGLTADLQTPAYETRIAIIQRKMEADGIFIPEEVIEYLAYSVDTNIRELEGVLISLIAHASLSRTEVNLELAKSTLKHIIPENETEVDIDLIQKTVAEYFGVDCEKLVSKTRKRDVVVARQVAMYFSKECTEHSLKSIGYHFGGRDHSTVIHAVQSVNSQMVTNPKYKEAVNDLKQKLRVKSA
ncbi:chromosomal replication initiator protein DnaA [Xanthovirga aplysinae]|uniref:chromosomal replication initiator protein DnaA n=1 Tax=Xanthovirga aplysinae TaxID=2529853 RepID=UPI0012BD3B52|nr:chromosomal replication initiator protein DnaA [Xanthovirga aplysinae]MTI30946.1 chromosomal replication initiator protein DnaA [Xanthovirga aplysinae]